MKIGRREFDITDKDIIFDNAENLFGLNVE